MGDKTNDILNTLGLSKADRPKETQYEMLLKNTSYANLMWSIDKPNLKSNAESQGNQLNL